MFIFHFILAFMVALILVTLFSGTYRRDTAWTSLAMFFMIIFFASWVGGVWITPFGPTAWGIAWMPFLLMGLAFALVIAASIPDLDRATRRAESQERIRPEIAQETAETEAAVSIFIWITLMMFVLLLVLNYAR